MKNKLKEIGEGWYNTLVKDVEIEEMAKARLAVCDGCEMKIHQFGIDVCGDCYCPLVAKSRSKDSQCGLDKWP